MAFTMQFHFWLKQNNQNPSEIDWIFKSGYSLQIMHS